MKTHSKEIMIIYNPASESGKRTAAHAKSIAPHVKIYSFEEAPITTTGWESIIVGLNMPPKKLLNKALSEYQEHFQGREFEEGDWLNILQRNPHLIKSPIGIRGKKVILCERPTDIHKLTENTKYKK